MIKSDDSPIDFLLESLANMFCLLLLCKSAERASERERKREKENEREREIESNY